MRGVLLGALLVLSGCATTQPIRLATLPQAYVESDMDPQVPEMRALFEAAHPELEVRSFSPRHEEWATPRGAEQGRRWAYIGAGVFDRRTQRCFYVVPVFSQRREEATQHWSPLKLREHMELEYLAIPERRREASRLVLTEKVDGVPAAPLECSELPGVELPRT